MPDSPPSTSRENSGYESRLRETSLPDTQKEIFVNGENTLLKDLIRLTGRSIAKGAFASDIEPSNLSRFLNGKPTVSEKKIKQLLKLLGVEGDCAFFSLVRDRVHLWSPRKSEGLPLVNVLSSQGLSYEMASVIPSPILRSRSQPIHFVLGGRPLLIRSLPPHPLRIVFRPRSRVVDWPHGLPGKFEPLPMTSDILTWKEDRDIPVDSETYHRFHTGTDITVEEFDQAWNAVSETKSKKEEAISWETMIDKAAKSGFSPFLVLKKLGLLETSP